MLSVPEGDHRKPVVWLHGRVKTPPFTPSGRIEAGLLLGLLQSGERLSPPHSRPLPTIGPDVRSYEFETQSTTGELSTDSTTML